jgi:hypothetical protein
MRVDERMLQAADAEIHQLVDFRQPRSKVLPNRAFHLVRERERESLADPPVCSVLLLLCSFGTRKRGRRPTEPTAAAPPNALHHV